MNRGDWVYECQKSFMHESGYKDALSLSYFLKLRPCAIMPELREQFKRQGNSLLQTWNSIKVFNEKRYYYSIFISSWT